MRPTACEHSLAVSIDECGTYVHWWSAMIGTLLFPLPLGLKDRTVMARTHDDGVNDFLCLDSSCFNGLA